MKDLHGIIFDMDGTLTLPGAIDFAKIRTRTLTPASVGILAFIRSLEDAKRQETLMHIVEEEERLGIERTALRGDAIAALQALSQRGLRLALITRNMHAAVDHLRDTLLEGSGVRFDAEVSRDSPHEAKPSPAGVLHIVRDVWRVEPHRVLMVGDALDDILAGSGAGCFTCAIGFGDDSDADESFRVAAEAADMRVHSLWELAERITTTEPARVEMGSH
jgi:HAD superfamily hydrolase (TIGR01549 family)